MTKKNEIQSPTFLTKISAVCLIIGLTLVYSIYKKKYVTKLVSDQSPILKQIPEFNLKNFYTNDPITINSLFIKKNKLAMVHIWATWCAPCEAELPDFLGLIKKFKDTELTVLLLAVNDDEVKMRRFLKRFGTFPENIIVAHDAKGELLPLFGTVKVPETYLFNENRRNLNKFIGPQDWLQERYVKRINFYLKSRGAGKIEAH